MNRRDSIPVFSVSLGLVVVHITPTFPQAVDPTTKIGVILEQPPSSGYWIPFQARLSVTTFQYYAIHTAR